MGDNGQLLGKLAPVGSACEAAARGKPAARANRTTTSKPVANSRMPRHLLLAERTGSPVAHGRNCPEATFRTSPVARTAPLPVGLVAALPAPTTTWPAAVAAKGLALRSETNGIAVRLRLVRKNDILSVQADLSSSVRSDRPLFYR